MYAEIESRLRLQPDPPRVALQRRSHRANASAGPLRASPRCTDCSREVVAAAAAWSWEALDSDARGRARAAARVDLQIFRDAQRQHKGR